MLRIPSRHFPEHRFGLCSESAKFVREERPIDSLESTMFTSAWTLSTSRSNFAAPSFPPPTTSVARSSTPWASMASNACSSCSVVFATYELPQGFDFGVELQCLQCLQNERHGAQLLKRYAVGRSSSRGKPRENKWWYANISQMLTTYREA